MATNNIIDRLFESFTELERAIHGARETLASKITVPPEVLQRLSSYDSILSKQRTLAKSLCTFINNGDWDEVSRHVNIINGLSSLIRDDARAILSSLSLNSDAPTEEQSKENYC